MKRAVLTVVLLGACTRAPVAPGPAPAPPPAGWRTTLRADHPLVGRVWAVAEQRFVPPGELLEAIGAAPFVLLGEKHDNPDAHALQAWALSELVARGRRPAVVFEMLRREQQSVIDDYVARGGASADELGKALGWARSGWPDFVYYRPLFAIALAAGLPIVAGDFGKDDLERLRAQRFEGLAPADRLRLGVDSPPGDEARRAIVAEMRASHCGHGTDEMFARMVWVQWARDAQLAHALVSGGGDGAVLIAGAGHVRSDRGVPYHLARLAPGAKAVAVSFMEVHVELESPGDYVEEGEPVLPFDYAYFTPRVDEDDPCARLRAR